MALLRSLTMTFSHVSAELNTRSASTLSSTSDPVFSRSLWHVTQYVLTSARAGVPAASDPAREAACAASGRDSSTLIVTMNAIDAQMIVIGSVFCRVFIITPAGIYFEPGMGGRASDRRHA